MTKWTVVSLKSGVMKEDSRFSCKTSKLPCFDSLISYAGNAFLGSSSTSTSTDTTFGFRSVVTPDATFDGSVTRNGMVSLTKADVDSSTGGVATLILAAIFTVFGVKRLGSGFSMFLFKAT